MPLPDNTIPTPVSVRGGHCKSAPAPVSGMRSGSSTVLDNTRASVGRLVAPRASLPHPRYRLGRDGQRRRQQGPVPEVAS